MPLYCTRHSMRKKFLLDFIIIMSLTTTRQRVENNKVGTLNLKE